MQALTHLVKALHVEKSKYYNDTLTALYILSNLDFIETLMQPTTQGQLLWNYIVNYSLSSHLDSENEGKTISYSHIISLRHMDSSVVSYRKTAVACKEAGTTEVTGDLEHSPTNLQTI